jgi:hypothetical protein
VLRPVRKVLALCALATLAAVLLFVLGSGTAHIVALFLVGLVTVALSSAAFYLVGLSEDRARERDDRDHREP